MSSNRAAQLLETTAQPVSERTRVSARLTHGKKRLNDFFLKTEAPCRRNDVIIKFLERQHQATVRTFDPIWQNSCGGKWQLIYLCRDKPNLCLNVEWDSLAALCSSSAVKTLTSPAGQKGLKTPLASAAATNSPVFASSLHFLITGAANIKTSTAKNVLLLYLWLTAHLILLCTNEVMPHQLGSLERDALCAHGE